MKYFGTDGIRQKADQFTPEFLFKIARGLVNYAGDEIKVLIGGDTRESSEWIIRDLEIAFENLGVEYSTIDVLPTPGINYCFYQMGFDFAVDVTASHNPYVDNGIKIFERGKTSGTKLSEAGCNAIEAELDKDPFFYDPGPGTFRESLHDDALDLYKSHLKDYLGEVNFNGLHIGMDCANGATSVVNKSIFEALGAKVELINADASYGTGINHDCGSTHLEKLQDLVKKEKLDFGVAFDGDGDRCLLVNHEGDVVDGDEIIAILANHLELDKIAITVMANQGLLNWAKDNNIHAEITAVGDSNVAAAMREKDIKIGGEQSGHIILPGEATGDGMLTALMITKVVAETKKSLKDLASIMTKFPQIILNMDATPEQKKALKEKDEARSLLLEFNQKLESVEGRLLVRPSGTENLIRITMWGNDSNKIEALANELKTKLGEVL
jgi:phosphoglucosamine mutase